MTSFIARISLFDSFKFEQTRVLDKLVKKILKNEIVNSEPLVDSSQMQDRLN